MVECIKLDKPRPRVKVLVTLPSGASARSVFPMDGPESGDIAAVECISESMGHFRSENPFVPAPAHPRACLDGPAGPFSALDLHVKNSVWTTRRSVPHCGVAKAAVS